jgi:hypothetical protein
LSIYEPGFFEARFQVKGQLNADEIIQRMFSALSLNHPSKRLSLVQSVFDTRKRRPLLSFRQLPTAVPINYESLFRDEEWLLVCEFP